MYKKWASCTPICCSTPAGPVDVNEAHTYKGNFPRSSHESRDHISEHLQNKGRYNSKHETLVFFHSYIWSMTICASSVACSCTPHAQNRSKSSSLHLHNSSCSRVEFHKVLYLDQPFSLYLSHASLRKRQHVSRISKSKMGGWAFSYQLPATSVRRNLCSTTLCQHDVNPHISWNDKTGRPETWRAVKECDA